jgi:bacillithiol system protein YtxJ
MSLSYIKDFELLEKVLHADKALLYKHSPICGVSHAAKREVERFVQTHDEFPVYAIDVRSQRPISQKAALRLDIRHESPQAILIVNGRAVWNASHFDITAESLAEAVDGA